MPNNWLGGKTIFDVLNLPKPKTLVGATGPGTGPYAADTKVSKLPVGKGGPLIPGEEKASDTGYGSVGDPNVYVAPEKEPVHQIRWDTQQRYPTLAHKGPPRATLPRFNTLYDALRTTSAWSVTNDVTVSGSITPNTASAVSAAVNAPANQGLAQNRVMQFPGGVQMYLMIRTFGFGASALTMTGSLYVYFVDAAGGQITPLAILTPTQFDTDLTQINTLLETPITDPGNTALGTLWAVMTNGGTPVACSWFLSFSYVYLLPDPAYNGWSDDTIPPLQEHYRLQQRKE